MRGLSSESIQSSDKPNPDTTIMDTNDDDDLYGDLNLSLDKKHSSDEDEQQGVHSKKKKRKNKDTETTTTTSNKTTTTTIRYASAAAGGNSNNNSMMESSSSSLLRRKIDTLQEENLRLKRNIGTLFRTAKHEIQRKDRRIERLQHEIDKRS